MARAIKFVEFMAARFPLGTFGRIAAVSTATENRADFVRTAVDRELKRREHTRRSPPKLL